MACDLLIQICLQVKLRYSKLMFTRCMGVCDKCSFPDFPLQYLNVGNLKFDTYMRLSNEQMYFSLYMYLNYCNKNCKTYSQDSSVSGVVLSHICDLVHAQRKDAVKVVKIGTKYAAPE